jgi:hypothetical protein
MSSQTETTVQPLAQAPKEKKPKLSAKYSKFMEFGYSLVQSLHASEALSTEGLESSYSQLKLFDSVDAQTGFYETVVSQSKETGKVMRKFITVRNKPPKAPRARKAAVPKEAVAGEAPKEKKPRQPRAKKTTNVVQDTTNDLIGELVAAANETVGEKKTNEPHAKKAVEVKGAESTTAKKARKPRAKKETPPPPPEVVASEELEEEEIDAQEIVIQGTTYLMDDSNQLYSIDTHAEIGTYNPETKEINHAC